MWKRAIITDGDEIRTFKINGAVLYVIGSDVTNALNGIKFNEIEWASTKFENGPIFVNDDEEYRVYPRRFYTLYVDDYGNIRSVLNEGLELDEWTRMNIIVELEALINELRSRK